MARGKATKANSGANIGFEATLWQAADKLRSNMDARAIATQEVIDELIKLPKQMSAANQRGVDLGLND
jgi:hypothetical protein